MRQVPDRKKLRREYLRKKGKVYTRWSRAIFLLLYAIFVFPWLLFFCCVDGVTWRTVAIFALIAIPMALLAVLFVIFSRHPEIRQALDAIPYVPPVTPDTLFADEILVRGSEEPPTRHSEVLLRAAKEVETPKVELLRMTQHR